MRRQVAALIVVGITATVFSQHDPGRNAVRLVARGRSDAARELVAKAPRRMNSPISEAEREFVLAMADCHDGKIDQAVGHALKALQNGLAVERFLAGPRNLFEPLLEHPRIETAVKGDLSNLVHGPLLGAVSDSSVKIWLRTRNEASVRIGVAAAASPRERPAPRHIQGRTVAAQDYTCVFGIEGLSPDTPYTYTIEIDGQAVSPAVRFRTLPRTGDPCHVTIAFGGGAGFTPGNERVWTTIGSRNPNALLLLGDNVYIDDPTHRLTQRYCYYRRQSQPEWRRLTASTSTFAIYDDHDFGTDDCVPGAEIHIPAWKRDVWRVFRQNWANPAYGGGAEQPGCWFDVYIGDVHVIMLDCRYYRDLEAGSMLGSVQKDWLFRTLAQSRGTFKLLASSVPWSPGVKPGSKDTWDGFPAEREEVFSFIESRRIDGVLLMAADRHRSDLRRIERTSGYDLYEVMSSRLTNVHTHGLVKNAKGSTFIMGYNKTCSFGLLDIDTAAAAPRVRYSIVTVDNELVDARTIPLTELSFDGHEDR